MMSQNNTESEFFGVKTCDGSQIVRPGKDRHHFSEAKHITCHSTFLSKK